MHQTLCYSVLYTLMTLLHSLLSTLGKAVCAKSDGTPAGERHLGLSYASHFCNMMSGLRHEYWSRLAFRAISMVYQCRSLEILKDGATFCKGEPF